MKSKQLNGRVIRMAVASALALGTSALGVNSYAAGSTSANLSVTATVAPYCKISTTAVAFGSYDPILTNAASGSPLNGTGEVRVTCTNGTTGASITLNQGSNSAGGSAALPQRRMIGPGGNFLSYALFSDSARSTVWSSTGVSPLGNGAQETFTVYGSVDGGQNVPVGDYSDTVVATISF
jgi:spore coat protein U-like protein